MAIKASQEKMSVKDNLLVQGPAQAALPSDPSDPPVAQLIQVDIDHIDLCELNPRRAPNTLFQKLYESILVNGLDNPIHITRLPDSARYSVSAGGNTRLSVFRKLRDDTRNPRFAKIPCIFKPYVSDSEVLKAHLRENDLREGLVFIDEAQAILNLKQLLEREAGGEPLSDAAFERALRDIGHFRSRRDIGRMRWAVEVLYPALPIAFERGLGPRKVDELGRLQSAYQSFCVDRVRASLKEGRLSSIPTFGDAAQAADLDARSLDEWVGVAFRPLFIDALAAHDDANFADGGVEAFRRSLDGRVGELFGLSATEARLNVDALMAVTVARRGATAGPSAAVAPAPTTEGVAPGVTAPVPALIEPESRPPDATGTATPPSQERLTMGEDGPGHELPTPPNRATTTAAIQTAPVASSAPLVRIGMDSEDAIDDPAPAAGPEDWPAGAGIAAVPDGTLPPDTPSAAPPEPRPTGPERVVLEAPPFQESESRRVTPAHQGDADSPRGRTHALAARVAQATQIQHLVQPDPDAPAGFSLRPLPADANPRETALWWLLASLSCGQGFDHVPQTQHVFVYDPAAFAHHFLFGLDDGQPPSEALLRDLFALIQAIVALAWAGQNVADAA